MDAHGTADAKIDSAIAIRQSPGASDVGANEVAEQVVVGAAEQDAGITIARNDIARSDARAANGVARAETADAKATVGDRFRASHIGADEIALDGGKG